MTMRSCLELLLLLAVAASAAAKPKNRFTRYPSWNSRMYPVWKDGDVRYRDSWKGGRVSFDVGNDGPTLTGAKVTFTIDVKFPHNQRVQPDGQVVWAEDGTLNGTKYRESEPVYPTQNAERDGVFPDGTAFHAETKQPPYVFVWKTFDKYWQVADGCSSSLTISTDGMPLGSYTVDIVIYHYRNKEKFIPIGYASTQFSITDQIPFAVSLDQVNDVMAADMRFVQNRAIAFTVSLHDPSDYLCTADITYNWQFGDDSGALISRERTVTHTYIAAGSFKPQVVIQAVIPDKACDPPVETPTPTPAPADLITTVRASLRAPSAPQLVLTKAMNVNVSPSDAEEDATEEEASSTSTAQLALETPTVATPLLGSDSALVPQGLVAGAAGMVMTRQARVVLVAKRAAGVKASEEDDCVIYRYGSYSTGIEVAEGIEKVEIVQMDNSVVRTAKADRNVVDLTVTCQGSLPKEVCSVILDAECLRPIHSECNVMEPSRECLAVLRHFFNDSGVYCIQVSMSNGVSLAAASAKVNVSVGPSLSSTGPLAMVLGVLVIALAVGTVAYTYKRFKSYSPLKEEVLSPVPQAHHGPTCSTFWNFLNRKGGVDDCPLLHDGLA